MCGGLFFAFTRYNDMYALPHFDSTCCIASIKENNFSYRRMRKAASEKLSTSSVKDFHETQMKEAVIQACDMLDKPAQWDRHFRRTAALTTVYRLWPPNTYFVTAGGD